MFIWYLAPHSNIPNFKALWYYFRYLVHAYALPQSDHTALLFSIQVDHTNSNYVNNKLICKLILDVLGSPSTSNPHTFWVRRILKLSPVTNRVITSLTFDSSTEIIYKMTTRLCVSQSQNWPIEGSFRDWGQQKRPWEQTITILRKECYMHYEVSPCHRHNLSTPAIGY